MRAVLAAVLLAIALIRPVAAEEPADAIQAVIERQIAAFQRNDLAEAFGHAAPGIQAMFRTPGRFGRMVETGYPMVWRPARYRMLDLAETPGGLVQTVLFVDRDRRFHEAAYLMREVDGVWRIAGVRLSALPGVGA
jgi:hypothetical protein